MRMLKMFLTIIFLLVNVPLFGQSGFKVIVNNSVNVEGLSTKELSNIFLKKKIEWSDGSSIKAVDLNSDSSIRIKFTNDIHNKNINAIKIYWQKQIFSGRNVPPVEKISDDEVLEFVKNNPGAIGYVSDKADLKGVKTVKIN